MFQVIRLVTTKLKNNPYNTVGVVKETSDMTLGQKLAMKYAIKEPQVNRQSSVNSEEDGSDWTWETCSDSDPEGVDSASISTTKSAKTLSKVEVPKKIEPPKKVEPKTYKVDKHTQKWLDYKVDKAEEPKPEIPEPPRERRLSAFSRLSSYNPISSVKTISSSASSSNSQDSPKTLKKYIRAYTGKVKRNQRMIFC